MGRQSVDRVLGFLEMLNLVHLPVFKQVLVWSPSYKRACLYPSLLMPLGWGHAVRLVVSLLSAHHSVLAFHSFRKMISLDPLLDLRRVNSFGCMQTWWVKKARVHSGLGQNLLIIVPIFNVLLLVLCRVLIWHVEERREIICLIDLGAVDAHLTCQMLVKRLSQKLESSHLNLFSCYFLRFMSLLKRARVLFGRLDLCDVVDDLLCLFLNSTLCPLSRAHFRSALWASVAWNHVAWPSLRLLYLVT